MAQSAHLRMETGSAWIEQRLGIRLQREQFLQFLAQLRDTVASGIEESLTLRWAFEPARGIKEVFNFGVHYNARKSPPPLLDFECRCQSRLITPYMRRIGTKTDIGSKANVQHPGRFKGPLA